MFLRTSLTIVGLAFAKTATTETIGGIVFAISKAVIIEIYLIESGKKLRPTASHPASTAAKASLTVFNPQILTRTLLMMLTLVSPRLNMDS